MIMKIGVPKEIHPGERRVAATPDTAKRLQSFGFTVLIETGAGQNAGFSDEDYKHVGCSILNEAAHVWSQADVVLKVRPPEQLANCDLHEADLLPQGGILISFFWPAQNQELLQHLCARQATVLGMDAIPRISRAQKLDALSAMANIAGYRAVVEAANHFGRFFAGQITAAGKIAPAKVLVIGAGVAGLAAIGTARGLGAIVRAFDTRPVVREQVESMGAEFLMLDFKEDGTGEGGYAKVMSKEFIDAEMALFRAQAQEVDVIITTALIPGKRAPILITKEMIALMRPGSVVVDLAAEQGGNCELTLADQIVEQKRVKIIGYTDLPSRMPAQASQLYGSNLCHLLDEMGRAQNFAIDEQNNIVRGALLTHQGVITWPPPKIEDASPPKLPLANESTTEALASTASASLQRPRKKNHSMVIAFSLAGLLLLGAGLGAPSDFLSHLTVFVLACFVGYQVIWNVSPALHTPLMSVTNAISGIIILGGMLQISGELSSATTILGAIAILLATINIAGGFLVTQRMLKMFRK